MKVDIKKANKKDFIIQLSNLVSLDNQNFTESISSEKWNEKNFLLDLHGKYQFSFFVFVDDILIGYSICSLKNDKQVHIHRFLIDKKFKNKNLGTKLINKIHTYCVKKNMDKISLYVNRENTVAQNFYLKNKFESKEGCKENFNFELTLRSKDLIIFIAHIDDVECAAYGYLFKHYHEYDNCLLYTSPSPRDRG